MNKFSSKNSNKTKSIPKNMYEPLQQPNSKHTNNLINKQTYMSESEKPKKDYVKKFFERRLKIEMEVRNKVFLEAMAKNKGIGKGFNYDSVGWQRKNEKDLNIIERESGLYINKISSQHFANRSESNENLPSITLNSKHNAPELSPKAKRSMNKSENYEDVSIRNISQKWKEMKTNKCFRKERIGENLYAHSQTEKMRKDKKNMRDEYQYEFNPEHNKFVEIQTIQKTQQIKQFSEKSVHKHNTCKNRNTLQNEETYKRTERSNGFKYEINETLREKLLSILEKQRGIKCRIENYGNSSEFLSQQSEKVYIQSSENVEMSEPAHELFKILPSNLVTEELKTFTEYESGRENELLSCLASKSFLEKENSRVHNGIEFDDNTEHLVGKMIERGESDEELQIHSDLNSSNERKIRMSVDKNKKEKSLVICAICQNNIEEELWKYVEIFKPEVESEDENENQNEIDSQSDKVLSIESERKPMLLECGHSFHKSCVLEWLKYKPICPLCKTVLREQNSDDEDISLEFANEANSNYSYENTEEDEEESEEEMMAEPEHNFHSLYEFEPEILNRSMNMSLNTDSRVNIEVSGNVTVFNSFSSSLDFIENQIDSHLQIEIENSSSSESSFTFKSIRDSLDETKNFFQF